MGEHHKFSRKRKPSKKAVRRKSDQQAKDIWKVVKSRWPDDYRIPDPEFAEVLAKWGKSQE
ncbi:MAG TPA: hypothetical protein VFV52_08575 [Bacilli bacterium]|nr:hypothetical protein [Bacilli bacterium]